MSRGVPFLKWPGGKRWIANEISAIVQPYLLQRYFEPFLGGGAVFFALQPKRATLSDVNADLINVYREVKRSPDTLIRGLKGMEVSANNYSLVRDSEPKSTSRQAIRFLYLNRTAFGGMFRLNRQGRFNVPFGGGGRTPDLLVKTDLLHAASSALKRVSLSCTDFGKTISKAGAGDVVYCDPTYTVAHDNNGFRRYNESVFSWEDQIRLAESAHKASIRGAMVVVSNAYHPSVLELYAGMPNCELRTLKRTSCIARGPVHRRQVCEALILLRPAPANFWKEGNRKPTPSI